MTEESYSDEVARRAFRSSVANRMRWRLDGQDQEEQDDQTDTEPAE